MASSRGSAAGRPTSPSSSESAWSWDCGKARASSGVFARTSSPATIRGGALCRVVDELAVSSQKRDADKKRQRKAHSCQ